MTIEPEFSFPVEIAALPPSGRRYEIKADAEARGRVAKRLDLQKIDALSASLEITFAAGGLIKVTGRVTAEVVQTCVVTLAPVPATVMDEIAVTFISEERDAKDRARREKAKAEEEEVVFEHDDDPPEVAVGGRIDLGEVAVVQMALALNPYPRAPGAAFAPAAWGAAPDGENTRPDSPFAALAQFKKPNGAPEKG